MYMLLGLLSQPNSMYIVIDMSRYEFTKTYTLECTHWL